MEKLVVKADKMANTKNSDNRIFLPAIALRGLVIYPGMTLQFDIGRERSLEAVKAALEGDRKIFLVAQKDVRVKVPEKSDIYNIGVIAEVKQIIKGNSNVSKVLVRGIKRAKFVEMMQSMPLSFKA